MQPQDQKHMTPETENAREQRRESTQYDEQRDNRSMQRDTLHSYDANRQKKQIQLEKYMRQVRAGATTWRWLHRRCILHTNITFHSTLHTLAKYRTRGMMYATAWTTNSRSRKCSNKHFATREYEKGRLEVYNRHSWKGDDYQASY